MSVTFWETMRGQRLADVLTRELPKLTKNKQYTESMTDDKVHLFLEERVAAGDRYINHFSFNGTTTVIMEKK